MYSLIVFFLYTKMSFISRFKHRCGMNTRKKGILLIGGEKPPVSMIRQVIAGASLVVAADSGFDLIVEHNLLKLLYSVRVVTLTRVIIHRLKTILHLPWIRIL